MARTRPGRTEKARGLRREMTLAEAKLWAALRDRRLAGLKFVRQMPLGPYIADFCCREAKLVVEIDGWQHAESRSDARRDVWMRDQGFRIVRFWNQEVTRNLPSVLDTICARAQGQWQ